MKKIEILNSLADLADDLDKQKQHRASANVTKLMQKIAGSYNTPVEGEFFDKVGKIGTLLQDAISFAQKNPSLALAIPELQQAYVGVQSAKRNFQNALDYSDSASQPGRHNFSTTPSPEPPQPTQNAPFVKPDVFPGIFKG